MHGQWLGTVKGANEGEIVINIDKSRDAQEGSIMFFDTSAAGVSLIARLNLEPVVKNRYKGFFFDIIGFNGALIIPPHVSPQSYLSSDGQIDLTISEDGVNVQGTWKTNLGLEGSFSAKNISGARVDSVERIISWREFQAQISDHTKYPYGFFFRGHQSSDYALRTRFHRESCWDLHRYHRTILRELFDQLGIFNATRYDINNQTDFGPALLLAQHHGFPTPLLDWTASPFIAAYFAFRPYDQQPDKRTSVRVYAFDAVRWRENKPNHAVGNLLSPGAVIAPLQLSMAGNVRAVAQDARSLFSNIDDMAGVIRILSREDKKPFLEHFDIAASEQDLVLRDLKQMGIHELKLFPDIDHACKVLSQQYFQ